MPQTMELGLREQLRRSRQRTGCGHSNRNPNDRGTEKRSSDARDPPLSRVLCLNLSRARSRLSITSRYLLIRISCRISTELSVRIQCGDCECAPGRRLLRGRWTRHRIAADASAIQRQELRFRRWLCHRFRWPPRPIWPDAAANGGARPCNPEARRSLPERGPYARLARSDSQAVIRSSVGRRGPILWHIRYGGQYVP